MSIVRFYWFGSQLVQGPFFMTRPTCVCRWANFLCYICVIYALLPNLFPPALVVQIPPVIHPMIGHQRIIVLGELSHRQVAPVGYIKTALRLSRRAAFRLKESYSSQRR